MSACNWRIIKLSSEAARSDLCVRGAKNECNSCRTLFASPARRVHSDAIETSALAKTNKRRDEQRAFGGQVSLAWLREPPVATRSSLSCARFTRRL